MPYFRVSRPGKMRTNCRAVMQTCQWDNKAKTNKDMEHRVKNILKTPPHTHLNSPVGKKTQTKEQKEVTQTCFMLQNNLRTQISSSKS